MKERSDWLAEQFEQNRSHLRSVAYRVLGSFAEADDAVQETWLRLNRVDASEINNLGGWLTTVVARVCLDILRSRTAHREESLDEPNAPEPAESPFLANDPEREVVLADSIGAALIVVLETLTPAERVAFVLHDMFDVPFEEIAPVVGKSTDAARQLASRARRRVQGASPKGEVDAARRRAVVDAFLAAARGGDFQALLELMMPEAVLRADEAAVKLGAENKFGILSEVRGSESVARMFVGRAATARLAMVGGRMSLVWAPGGKVRAAFNFTLEGDKIAAVELIADPERIQQLAVEILHD